MSDFNTATIKAAIPGLAAHLEENAAFLNEADAKLGDGDLGVTMQRGARGLLEIVDDLPDDLGMVFMRCAQAFTKTSGSSYGTLLATGLMTAAKACKGRESVPWSKVPALLGDAQAAMMVRGKGALGEKTVLDTLEAARLAAKGLDDPEALLAAALTATEKTLDRLRDEPARQGRARMFAEKSVGLDDPGMLAFRCLLEGLKG
ncbi:dihydroxyacetone kinase subunit L [Pelagibius litoralis]|uniref:Dihydroxyacetone kinase subunit L n=1 Tax=Pelagibius litoralis TaxID=374515 RepID=A0A967F0C7_9PROT|nr:dihydroxyacetone kinase subunit L [Pelagibius litoralis]NIA70690.1 dihydroxyacetone kinase subunit L [Pelagibius litoralis]